MGTSVIVVDDDNDNLEVLSEYLEIKDVEVVAKAKDGSQAFEMYKKLKPDVVLLDVVMDRYDGFYAFKKIREFDNNAKVIFVTAAISETTQKKLFQTDVDGVLFKPFEMDKLVNAISLVKNGKKIMPETVRST